MTQTPNTDQDTGPGNPPGPAPSKGPGPLRRAAWTTQERVLWRGAESARAAADGARWPLESVSWWLRSHVAWPLADGWRARRPAARVAIAGAATLLVASAGVAGAYIARGGDQTPAPVVAAEPAPIVKPAPVEPVSNQVADAPVLRGAAPSFAPETDAAAAKASQTDGVRTPQADSAPAPPAPKPDPSGKALGPAPLKVAKQFANAFVDYEVGVANSSVKDVFRKTATSPLARSLARRPPRQPAGVKVPKAQVLNVVPGPHRGGFVAVSVSLLRVDATSELRLQLQQIARKWRVSDVRG